MFTLPRLSSVSFSAFALLICASFLSSNYFIFHKPSLRISDLSTLDNFPLLLLSAWLLLIDLFALLCTHLCFSLLVYYLFFLLGLFIFLVMHITLSVGNTSSFCSFQPFLPHWVLILQKHGLHLHYYIKIE